MAICRGAVFKGFLEGPSVKPDLGLGGRSGAKLVLNMTSSMSVVSTIARLNLGIQSRAPFQERVDLESEKYWDDDKGKYFTNHMN